MSFRSFIKLQANIQNLIQPGNWLKFNFLMHSEECEWIFQKSIDRDRAKEFIIEAGKNMSDFSLRSIQEDVILFDYYTPRGQWMDQVRIEVIAGDPCKASLLAKSTGVVPLIVPFAPLLSTILFWVPFQDYGGKTSQEIALLQREFMAISNTSVESRTTRYSLGNPRRPDKGK